ncbi:MAG: Na/Pi cotransporter family protein [Eubacterium sp.]|nr:Na/Pi cotransporter family protein [Eubacterium sp.]
MLSVLELFGGVGLFLYGMSMMGSSLEKLAGSGLEKILETLTTSKKKGVGAIKGWALGCGVTGIIQSSAATTIMLIGFVNAGIMKLAQAIPVVYGANVGSTVTAQILRLGDLSSDNIVLQLLKPSSFAPMLLAVGVFMHLTTKKMNNKNIAGILIGLGTLFYGMTMMEEVFAPLKESEKFRNFFTSFENPFIGILTGLVITAIIQSSSASVGILQALSATGSVTYATAVPIIIGQNIGKCMTIILGSIGANKKAKRVAFSYLFFNIIGAIFFTAVIYSIYYTVGIPIFEKVVNRGNIANIHLAFNLIISIILLPFTNQMSKLTGKALRDSDENPDEQEFQKLDDMLLRTPGIALSQCKDLMDTMGDRVQENYILAVKQLVNYDKNAFKVLNENEDFIDKCETALTAYVMKLDRKSLTPDNRQMMLEILSCIGDYERIGDYSISIAYTAEEMYESKISFSEAGNAELSGIVEATRDIIEMTFDAFKNDKDSVAIKIDSLKKAIDELKSLAESHHVERLSDGDCGVLGGAALFDLITDMERIAIHARSVAYQIIKRVRGEAGLDAYHGNLIDKSSEEYQALRRFYVNKYSFSKENMVQIVDKAEKMAEEKAVKKAEKKNAKKSEDASAGTKSSKEKKSEEKSRSDKSRSDKSGSDKSGSDKSRIEESKSEGSGSAKSSKDKKASDSSKKKERSSEKQENKSDDKKKDRKKSADKKESDKKV